MNIDKVRLMVNVFDSNGDLLRDYLPSGVWIPSPHHSNSEDAVMFSLKYGKYYLSGSPLKWFYGHNICGPQGMNMRLQSWANEVMDAWRPGYSAEIVTINELELFIMIDCESEDVVNQTIYWLYMHGFVLKSKYRPMIFPSEGAGIGTLYFRPIGDGTPNTRWTLIRGYRKYDEIVNTQPYSLMLQLPSLPRCLRLEFDCRAGWLRPRIDRNDPLSMDLNAMLRDRMSRIVVCDPEHLVNPRELTDMESEIVDHWMQGEDVTTRCSAEMMKNIRYAKGFDLLRRYAEVCGYRYDLPHLSLEEISDTTCDIEPVLWEEAQRLLEGWNRVC